MTEATTTVAIPKITDGQRRQIETRARERLDAQGLKGKKRRDAEVEIFAGAMIAIQALIETQETKGKLLAPPAWVMALMSGRGIVD